MPPLINGFGAREFLHCGKGTDQARRRFPLKQQGVEHGWTSEIGACAQARNTQNRWQKCEPCASPQAAFRAAEICRQQDIVSNTVIPGPESNERTPNPEDAAP